MKIPLTLVSGFSVFKEGIYMWWIRKRRAYLQARRAAFSDYLYKEQNMKVKSLTQSLNNDNERRAEQMKEGRQND